MGLHLLHRQPLVIDKLYLLNPSTGRTLHSIMQPVLKLPEVLGRVFSKATHLLHYLLYPVCLSSVWPVLKAIVFTSLFHCIFIVTAFLGGYPPEQPTYFTAYCEDIFISPFHTQHLLDLILSLDETSPYSEISFPGLSLSVGCHMRPLLLLQLYTTSLF
jgi:hypothetical protein